MIRTIRRKFLVTSAVTAVAALSLSVMPAQAISPRSETGVTSSTIKLGITLPLTGSASYGYKELPGAMKAYFDYVNANGGVNGRKISLVVKNDAYLPKQAIQNTQDLIGKDKVFAIVGALGTANNKAVASAVTLAVAESQASLLIPASADLLIARNSQLQTRFCLHTLWKQR